MKSILNNWENISSVDRKKVLIAAHRGKYGAQIPENTVESCEFALRLGADIIEVDVCRTIDGGLVLLHGPKVDRVTNGTGPAAEYTFEEIRQLKFISAIGQKTNKSLNTLDELLESFKGRCLINLDRCWNYMDDVFDAVKRHDMADQVLFKSPKPIDESLQWLESRNFEPHFMPIVKEYDALTALTNNLQKASIPAVEILFKNDDSLLIAPETVKLLHDKNMKIWINTLTLNEVLAGGHDDTVSVLADPDDGWGWLIDRGIDILQTDWVMELEHYLNKKVKSKGETR